VSKVIAETGPACEICDRREGSLLNLGEERLPPFDLSVGGVHVPPLENSDRVPLGAVTQCPECGRLSCPDCQHERDCCFDPGE
jgi:hypothetical protein